MNRYQPFIYLVLWVLLFAGRSPESATPEGQPSGKPATAVTVPAARPAPALADARAVAPGRQQHQARHEAHSAPSIRHDRQQALPGTAKFHWQHLLGPLGGALAWRLWRRQRSRSKPSRPARPAMANWLRAIFAILAALAVFGGGMLACAGILGITWASFGWMVLAIICALAFMTGLVLLAIYLVDNSNLQLPRNIFAQILIIAFIIIPLVIGGGLILSFLGFLLFLNVFLAPLIGLTLTLGVMSTTIGTVALALSVIAIIMGDA